MHADLETLTTTRKAWHALAEHVVAKARWVATGRIGLVLERRGFATPWYAVPDGEERVVVEDAYLSVERRSTAGLSSRGRKVTTIRECADFLEIGPGAPASVYTPATALDLDAPLVIDAEAAHALTEWFERVQSGLETFCSSVGVDRASITLWPEHFDLATTYDMVNYGGSPGDEWSAEPYAYVGPYEVPTGDFWDAPFGASRRWDQVDDGAAVAAFFAEGREAATPA